MEKNPKIFLHTEKIHFRKKGMGGGNDFEDLGKKNEELDMKSQVFFFLFTFYPKIISFTPKTHLFSPIQPIKN